MKTQRTFVKRFRNGSSKLVKDSVSLHYKIAVSQDCAVQIHEAFLC